MRILELMLVGRELMREAPGFLRWSLILFVLLSQLIYYSFRAKYHKLKFGTDLNQGEKKTDLSEQGTHPCNFLRPPQQSSCLA